MFFNMWDILVPSLISAGVSLLGNSMNIKAQKDATEEQKDADKEKMILELQMQQLKDKYGLLSRGGGGGGGGVDKTAGLLAAYQNFIASNRASRDRQSQAFQEIGRAVQAPLLK